MASASPAWVEWAAEYTKAAQADARPPSEWAARVAAAAAAAGESEDARFSAGLAEMLARVLLSGGSSGAAPAAAWKYAEAALAARLASPALLLALLSSRYVYVTAQRSFSPVRAVWEGGRRGECARDPLRAYLRFRESRSNMC
jgi:hypothetical protein